MIPKILLPRAESLFMTHFFPAKSEESSSIEPNVSAYIWAKKIHNLKQYPLVFTLVSPDRGSRQFCSPLDLLLIHATAPKTHSRFEFSHFLSASASLAPPKTLAALRLRLDTMLENREKKASPRFAPLSISAELFIHPSILLSGRKNKCCFKLEHATGGLFHPVFYWPFWGAV